MKWISKHTYSSAHRCQGPEGTDRSSWPWITSPGASTHRPSPAPAQAYSVASSKSGCLWLGCIFMGALLVMAGLCLILDVIMAFMGRCGDEPTREGRLQPGLRGHCWASMALTHLIWQGPGLGWNGAPGHSGPAWSCWGLVQLWHSFDIILNKLWRGRTLSCEIFSVILCHFCYWVWHYFISEPRSLLKAGWMAIALFLQLKIETIVFCWWLSFPPLGVCGLSEAA